MLQSVTRKPNPNEKILNGLIPSLVGDRSVTPLVKLEKTTEKSEKPEKLENSKKKKGDEAGVEEGETTANPEDILARKGAENALQCIATQFGENLFNYLPKLWNIITEPIFQVCNFAIKSGENVTTTNGESLQQNSNNNNDNTTKKTENNYDKNAIKDDPFGPISENIELAQSIVDKMQVIRTMLPFVHVSLHSKVFLFIYSPLADRNLYTQKSGQRFRLQKLHLTPGQFSRKFFYLGGI